MGVNKYNTEVTVEEIANGIRDEYGFVYSNTVCKRGRINISIKQKRIRKYTKSHSITD